MTSNEGHPGKQPFPARPAPDAAAGKRYGKLYDVVETLARGEKLDPRHSPHPLIGNWRPFWDCHIEPDWLLIYRVQEDCVELYRTGSHADLFE